jgi:hypothetical protein
VGDDWLPSLFPKLCIVVEKHLDATGEDAEWLADRLMSHGLLNGFVYEVFDRPRDVSALDRVGRALLELERAMSDATITGAAKQALSARLVFGPYHGKAGTAQDDLKEYIDTHGRKNMDAFHLVSGGANDFREAVKATIAHINKSPLAKRSLSQINSEAVGLVEGCRFVWREAKGRDAPSKDLNLASKFAAFLADVMETCEVDGDPRSVFLAWARLQKSP